MTEESSGREKALEILRRWQEKWDEVPTEEVDLYGKVYAPKSVDQLMLLFSQLAMLDIGGWRGQADVGWRLDPSLVRRWRAQGIYGSCVSARRESTARTREGPD